MIRTTDSLLYALREAIVSANAAAGADTIDFDASLSGKTILLAHGELLITSSVTISGLGAGELTVDASGNDPTPAIKKQDGSRVFNISRQTFAADTVLIQGLTITGGDSGDFDGGGAIINFADLTITDCTIANNVAYQGGAVCTMGSLQIISCDFHGNATWRLNGGAIYSSWPNVSIDNSTFSDNTSSSAGGAVFQSAGSIVVTESVFTRNSSVANGGGIFGDSVSVTSSTFVNNATSSVGAGGAVNCKTLTMASSIVSNNTALSGGGIQCRSNAKSSSISDSTIIGNTAQKSGGGADFSGIVTLSNTIISENSALRGGGGIFIQHGSEVTINDCTITANFVGSEGNYGVGGGGVSSSGSLIMNSCSIIGNTSTGGGAGVSTAGWLTRLTGCAVVGNNAGNFGGGIAINGYSLELRDCDVSGNTAVHDGGGIAWQSYSAPLLIERSTICGNSSESAAGIYLYGQDSTISQSNVSQNSATKNGGGIYNIFGGSRLNLNSSTISGNSAANGGGVFTYGKITAVNSLINDNTAINKGGGVFSSSFYAPTFRSCTITGNSADAAGGGAFVASSLILVDGSIVAGNTRNVMRDT